MIVTADDAGNAVDALAEQLQRDPVVVEQALGSGEAEQYDERISALVRSTPFPVYVVLRDQIAPERDGLDAMALLLSRRMPDPKGLYILKQTDGILSVTLQGYGAPAHVTSPMRFDAQEPIEQESGQYVLPAVIQAEIAVRAAQQAGDPSTWEDRDLAGATLVPPADQSDVATRARDLGTRNSWRPDRPAYVSVEWVDPGRSTMLATLLGSGVLALVALLGLRPWRRRGPRTEVLAPTLAVERSAARRWEKGLARKVAATASTPTDEDLTVPLDVTRILVESDDVAEVIGARMLACRAVRDADWRERVSCFFDPRHDDARLRTRWRLGQGQIEVPVCSTCHAAVTGGRQPRALMLPGKRQGLVPYYERDDVWARTGYGSLTASAGDFAAEILRARTGGER